MPSDVDSAQVKGAMNHVFTVELPSKIGLIIFRYQTWLLVRSSILRSESLSSQLRWHSPMHLIHLGSCKVSRIEEKGKRRNAAIQFAVDGVVDSPQQSNKWKSSPRVLFAPCRSAYSLACIMVPREDISPGGDGYSHWQSGDVWDIQKRIWQPGMVLGFTKALLPLWDCKMNSFDRSSSSIKQ